MMRKLQLDEEDLDVKEFRKHFGRLTKGNLFNKALPYLILISALLIVVFVWPTPYRYEKTNAKMDYGAAVLLLRINRVTGSASALTVNGWEKLSDGWFQFANQQKQEETVRKEAPAPAPAWPPMAPAAPAPAPAE